MPVDGALAALPVEEAAPARRFYAWPGKRNYEGSYWFATTGRHVAHESLLEADYLMAADHGPAVVAVSSQPLIFLWPRRTTTGGRWHVPDFFVRLADGSGRLIDVRTPARVAGGEVQFAFTRQACQWAYEVFTGIPEPFRANLRWVSGFRHPRHSPSPGVAAALVEAFTPGTSMAAGLRRAARLFGSRAGGDGMSAVSGNLLHMLYRHRLRTDLNVPLTMSTHVEAEPAMAVAL
ncbi:TnsA-like heteromeric transposase endonuclease subunit [Bogoriella caseilytica]|uniref:TnsA endonuclease-like protein n=1 Tax=Bogoriella caseilytica TaxID=56055 RepID=A0A3N2BGS8_9MICO|nr:TnsA-like heteromeric transposase endonuclease subunit [Bogoriella caseilytica]ROR74420.1 hypothetical protein EDD31_2835 [Bogoriella caseilytica]